MKFSELAYDIAKEHRLKGLLEQWNSSVACPVLLEELLDQVAGKAMAEGEDDVVPRTIGGAAQAVPYGEESNDRLSQGDEGGTGACCSSGSP